MLYTFEYITNYTNYCNCLNISQMNKKIVVMAHLRHGTNLSYQRILCNLPNVETATIKYNWQNQGCYAKVK